MLFFGKFYVTKKSKSVEIVFGISKAMSGSIAMKIRQPFLWTDPYLHCLIKANLFLCQNIRVFFMEDGGVDTTVIESRQHFAKSGHNQIFFNRANLIFIL